jgi:hypothetical protein
LISRREILPFGRDQTIAADASVEISLLDPVPDGLR